MIKVAYRREHLGLSYSFRGLAHPRHGKQQGSRHDTGTAAGSSHLSHNRGRKSEIGLGKDF